MALDVMETKRARPEGRRGNAAASAAEQWFRVLAENVPALFSYIDTDERYVFVNKGYEELWGRPSHEIVGRTVSELLGDDYEVAKPHIASALGGSEVTYEHEFGLHGSHRWMRVRYVPDRDGGRRIKGFFTLAVDRTRERQALQSLEESRDRLASVLDNVAEAIVTIDKTGRIDGFNPAAEKMFGHSAEEVIGRNVTVLMPEPHRSDHDDYIDRYLQTGEARIIGIGRQVTAQRKDGSTFPVELAVSQIDHQERFTGIIRDITERRRAEEALELKREELRMLSARLLKAEESERRRISRELHDDLNQRLAMLTVDLEKLRGTEGLEPSVRSTLEELREQVAALSDDVHSLAYRLHPSILDDLGLVAAVRSLLGDFAARHDISFSVRERHFPKHIPMELASCLYRVVQESLTNVARHSESAKVQIRFAGADGRLGLTIRDYGRGFDVEEVRTHRQSLGILSMEERVRLAGGKFSIWSSPRRGTRIRVTCPTEPEPR